MTRFGLGFLVALSMFLSGFVGSAVAETVRGDDGWFVVEFPLPVTAKKQSGKTTAQSVGYTSYVWDAASGQQSWSTNQSTFEKPIAPAYDNMINSGLKAVNMTLRSRKAITVDGVNGVEFIGDSADGIAGRTRLFVVSPRAFAVTYTGPKGSELSAPVEAYFRSFHFTRH